MVLVIASPETLLSVGAALVENGHISAVDVLAFSPS